MPIDVAVMPISDPPFIKAFLHCATEENPEGCGTNQENNQPFKNQIGEGPEVMDRAIFFGFPEGDVGKEAVEPFARAGVVSYTARNPELKVGDLFFGNHPAILIDAPSFPGNSGGPVIKEIIPLKGEVQLLGLVTGGHIAGKDYAIVTSVKEIRDTLRHARSIAKITNNDWREQPPRLGLKCKPHEE